MPLPLYDMATHTAYNPHTPHTPQWPRSSLTLEELYAKKKKDLYVINYGTSYGSKSNHPHPVKKIIGNFTHTKREDRVSQRTWYENVTYPDEVRELNRSNALRSSFLKTPK
jgi:hypothetical protein